MTVDSGQLTVKVIPPEFLIFKRKQTQTAEDGRQTVSMDPPEKAHCQLSTVNCQLECNEEGVRHAEKNPSAAVYGLSGA